MYKVLLLFIILILGLLLCSFLGGNCLSEGFQTSSSSPVATISTATGVRGNTAVAVKGQNKTYTASNVNGNVNANSFDNYNHYTGQSYPSTFYGPNGSTAKVVNTNGAYTLVITDANGNTGIYVVSNSASSSSVPASSAPASSAPASSAPASSSSITQNTYYGPSGGSAVVTTDNNGNYIIKVVQSDGTVSVYTVQNTQNTLPPASTPSINAGTYTTMSGNTYGYATGPAGNTAVASSNTNQYNQSLPPGIPANMIPSGQQDLYILKSQVVPPVCPACPVQPASCPREEKCPPCPACARCPEPSFECKKVPNYNSQSISGGSDSGSDVMPVPVLSSFSTFGM